MEFLTGHKLNAAIEDVIRTAEVELLIVSPYIKLHERYIEALKTLHDKPEVKVTLLFGKAHGDKTVTFHKDSIAFFKSLPNIEIAHRKNLHAKFYANEESSVMTSMNLYAYSQDVNIETGYSIDTSLSTDQAIAAQTFAWNHFFEVFDGADEMFNKEAQFESRLLGLSKKYTGSEVTLDNLDETGNLSDGGPAIRKRKPRAKRERSAQSPLDAQTVKPKKKAGAKARDGYCIATAEPIPLNVARPMAYPAYKAWVSDTSGDIKAPMNYCHFSGEATAGKTTVERPIAKEHWKAAQAALAVKG
ncbi:phospholipase D-like domain-containing protein [Flavobacteriales bacterium]|nr:phospholipase D-like domain-containing protein [Flavobacteriales bacterium]